MIPALAAVHGGSFNKTSGTTLALTGMAAVTAGNTLIAWVLFDNAATVGKPRVSSITKGAGETANWVSLGWVNHPSSTSAGAFAGGELMAIQPNVNWAASGSITVALDTAVTMKAIQVLEFSGVQAVLRSTVGTAYSTTTTAASATTTGTTPVINDFAVGFLFGSNVAVTQAGDNDTTAGSWSSAAGFGSTGGSGATNNFGLLQYKVLTAATHQTFNSSTGMQTGNGSIVAILQSIPDPSITQAAYRFYADGTESGSTALAAQDTAPTVNVTTDANLQLRARLQATTAVAVPATDDFQLQWERNASGTWSDVGGGGSLVDSQGLTESAIALGHPTGALLMMGQSFLGNGSALTRVGFFVGRTGNPVYNVKAELYAHSGAFGTSSVGTGSPLAATAQIAASTFGLTSQWVYFDFDGTFTLGSGTPYVVTLTASALSASGTDVLNVHRTTTTSSHAGNYASFTTVWNSNSSYDLAFRLYTNYVVVPYASTNLTDAAATTNRLTGGTGSFVAGKVSEDGVVDDLGWTASNYTEVLYSITLKSADLANADTLRFRILKNAATTNMTYTATPTINVTKAVVVPVSVPTMAPRIPA